MKLSRFDLGNDAKYGHSVLWNATKNFYAIYQLMRLSITLNDP